MTLRAVTLPPYASAAPVTLIAPAPRLHSSSPRALCAWCAPAPAPGTLRTPPRAVSHGICGACLPHALAALAPRGRA